jgi:hypothetical protein
MVRLGVVVNGSINNTNVGSTGGAISLLSGNGAIFVNNGASITSNGTVTITAGGGAVSVSGPIDNSSGTSKV